MIHLINLQVVNFDGVENIAAFRGEVDINGNFCYVKVVSAFLPVHSPDYTYIFQNKLNAMTTEHKLTQAFSSNNKNVHKVRASIRQP